MRTLLMTAGLLAASCTSHPTAPMAQTPSPLVSLFTTPEMPVPTPSSPRPAYPLMGVVYELGDGGRRPIADRRVTLWVDGLPTTTVTDRQGRYSAQVPNGRVFASAWERGENQPCLSTTLVEPSERAAALDVEVVRPSAGVPMPTEPGPTVSGTVFSTRGGARTPAPAANVWIEAAYEAYVAFTQTDANGRFWLCRMYPPVGMYVYVGNDEVFTKLPGNGDITLEIDVPAR